MQRWTAVLLGTLFVAAIVVVILESGRPASTAPGSRDEHGQAWAADAAAARFEDAGRFMLGDPNLTPPGLSPESLRVGGTAQPLPEGAPRVVRFGVVLVKYRGAQGAPAAARTKEEALARARTLLDLAKTDFKSAVQQGDPGSDEDVGRMPRGVLEPETEYQIFVLEPGAVAGPIDTPRGFWIVRRKD